VPFVVNYVLKQKKVLGNIQNENEITPQIFD
jgi:hypothetical protein